MSDDVVTGPGIYTLPNVLDPPAAQLLKELLVEAASSSSSIVLDGTNVERVGTGSTGASGRRANFWVRRARFTRTWPSAVLWSAFSDLGLATELERWRNA